MLLIFLEMKENFEVTAFYPWTYREIKSGLAKKDYWNLKNK